MSESISLTTGVFSERGVLYGSSLLSAIAVAYFLFKKYFRSKDENKPACDARNPKLINDVLFFSEKYALCSSHDTYQSTCDSEDCGLKKLKKIIAYIDSATTSLDVCVYTITSYKLTEVILKKFKEGVQVRVITDEGMAFGDGSQIPLLRRKRVLVRARQSTQFLMHHKFAIVDKSLLINGSFNWTSQATFGNWENVYVCNHPQSMVQKYSDEFEELWKMLSLRPNA